MDLIEDLAAKCTDMPLHLMTQTVIEQSGLIAYHEAEKGEKGQARVENLEELVSAARNFENTEEDEELSPRSEEHTSELQSLMRISYAVICMKKKTQH